MIRLIDIILSFFGLLIFTPIFLVIYVLCFLETGSPIFKQVRLGKHKRCFTLFKFRTMEVSTQSLPTHLISSQNVTRFGKILRKTKIDEMPQLFNVLKGDMSLVGPRPNMTSQVDLIVLREKFGIYNVKPGITGLAQINNIDMSDPDLLCEKDCEMLEGLNVFSYTRYILKTLIGQGMGDTIR